MARRASLKRRGPRREPYERVLIVCEGAKTEPNYLRELIDDLRLSTANVVVTGDCGSAPTSVVEHAIEIFQAEPDFDAVYCVFDRDGHSDFERALQRIADKPLIRRAGRTSHGPARFEAIPSIPCFEYWLLLHFEYTTAHLPRFSDVHRRLKQFSPFQVYQKGSQRMYLATKAQLPTALTNADRANDDASKAGTDNPTTQIPTLIRYLQDLAKKKKR